MRFRVKRLRCVYSDTLLAIMSSRGQVSVKSSMVFFRSRKACHFFRDFGSFLILNTQRTEEESSLKSTAVQVSCSSKKCQQCIKIHFHVIFSAACADSKKLELRLLSLTHCFSDHEPLNTRAQPAVSYIQFKTGTNDALQVWYEEC